MLLKRGCCSSEVGQPGQLLNFSNQLIYMAPIFLYSMQNYICHTYEHPTTPLSEHLPHLWVCARNKQACAALLLGTCSWHAGMRAQQKCCSIEGFGCFCSHFGCCMLGQRGVAHWRLLYMSYREKTNRSLKKVLLMRGCCKSEVLPKEVLLFINQAQLLYTAAHSQGHYTPTSRTII